MARQIRGGQGATQARDRYSRVGQGPGQDRFSSVSNLLKISDQSISISSDFTERSAALVRRARTRRLGQSQSRFPVPQFHLSRLSLPNQIDRSCNSRPQTQSQSRYHVSGSWYYFLVLTYLDNCQVKSIYFSKLKSFKLFFFRL
jgi:hypothetical protein